MTQHPGTPRSRPHPVDAGGSGRKRVGSAEEVVQEALVLLAAAVVPVVALLAVVAVMPGGILRLMGAVGRRGGVGGLAVRGRRRCRVATTVGRRGRRGIATLLDGRGLRRTRGASRTRSVPVGLGREEFLQLTAVEEEPAALGALVDRDAAALVDPHLAMTLRTGHLHVTNGTRPCHRLAP